MKLYIVPGSPNARKVQAVVNHLGLKPEIIRNDLFKGDMKEDDYKAINPNSKTPALEDGDLKLWESEAINMYLCTDKVPDNTLFAPESRIDIARWQFWSVSHYNRWLSAITWECVAKPALMQQEPDQRIIDHAMGYLPKFLDVLNDHLEGRKFMVGNDWTLADYSIGFQEPFLFNPEILPVNISDYKNVQAFYDRLRDNPHWAETAVPMDKVGRAA